MEDLNILFWTLEYPRGYAPQDIPRLERKMLDIPQCPQITEAHLLTSKIRATKT